QLQAQGPLAFNRSKFPRMALDGPDLAQQLKLTDDQVERGRTIAEGGDKEIEKVAAAPTVMDPKAGAPSPESIRRLVESPEFKAAKRKIGEAARNAWASLMQRID